MSMAYHSKYHWLHWQTDMVFPSLLSKQSKMARMEIVSNGCFRDIVTSRCKHTTQTQNLFH